jgi:SET domain-containing protein
MKSLHTTDSNNWARGLCVRKSPLDGFGCFATIQFPKASPIAEYAGEKITQSEATRRMRGSNGKCISELDTDCYIDGSVDGNHTRFINHSCEPNADVLIVDGFMVIFAIRDISPGEEVTVDYLNSFEEDLAVCQCGASSCQKGLKHKAA